MNDDFSFVLKLALFAAEAVIFIVLIIKSGKLAKIEEKEFLAGK